MRPHHKSNALAEAPSWAALFPYFSLVSPQRTSEDKAKMSTWLTAIVISAATEVASTFTQSANLLRRKASRAKSSAGRDTARPPTKPRRGMLQAELTEGLAEATTQLSPTLRKALQLRDLDGLTIRETAHLLGVPRWHGKGLAREASCKTEAK